MGFAHQPFLIIISSPSGAGKSTLCKMITQNHSNVKLSVSATTRKRRPGEIEGKDYIFITKEEYDQKVNDQEFLEYANIFDNFYGTPKKMVDTQLENGNDVLFDIDWQGARQLISSVGKENIISIFILPPSITELQKRLEKRAQDSKETVERRMKEAKSEVSHWHEYDYVLVNDDVKRTYEKINQIITANRIKKTNHDQIRSFVSKLLNN